MDDKMKVLVERLINAATMHRKHPCEVYDMVALANEAAATICAQAEENERLKKLILSEPAGHGKPCYYCGELTSSIAGNSARWPVPLCHKEEPGKVAWHHIGCVMKKLREGEAAEAKLHQALEWLKDSKRFVEDAGSDEDPEACRRAVWLISKIDALLTRLANPEPTKTDDPAILHQRLEERICNCGAAGQNEQHEPWCAWQDATRTDRAISALETPDSSLSRVPNTIRQSIKEVIERERSRAESAEAERDALKAELARIKSAEGCDVEGALDAYMDAPNKGLPYDSLVQQRMSAALAAGCAPLRAEMKHALDQYDLRGDLHRAEVAAAMAAILRAALKEPANG